MQPFSAFKAFAKFFILYHPFPFKPAQQLTLVKDFIVQPSEKVTVVVIFASQRGNVSNPNMLDEFWRSALVQLIYKCL